MNAYELDLGPCCICQATAGVRNLVMLHFKSPSPGAGCWGCDVCGLPLEGACAVLCDGCAAAVLRGEPIKYAVLGAPALGERVPIEDLTEPFEHNPLRHSLFAPQQARQARWN